MKHLKSKSRRGLVTRRIVYRNRAHSRDRPQEIRADVRRGEVIDAGYAAAMDGAAVPRSQASRIPARRRE